MRRLLVAVLVLVALVLGMVAQSMAFDLRDALWIPDALTGWALIGAGLFAWGPRRSVPVGLLLGAAGVTWFLGLWPETLFLHRGVLLHLLFTWPGWRPRTRYDAVAVGLGYVGAVLPPLWRGEATAIALCLVLVALSLLARRHRRWGAAGFALGVFLGAVVAGSVLRAWLGLDAVVPVLLVYYASVASCAVLLVIGLPHRSPEQLTDLVVELEVGTASPLRDRLAQVLGDPSLQLGHWSPRRGGFYSDEGSHLDVDNPGAGRMATVLTRGGAPLAVLVHDAQTMRDPTLARAVANAIRLADTHQQLRDSVDEQYRDLYESRRRLVLAADDELRRLDERLERGPRRRLAALTDELELLTTAPGLHAVEADHVRRAHAHAVQAQADLDHLSRGLDPVDLARGGLAAALGALAKRAPSPVVVRVNAPPVAREVEVTAYYVCAEALANVAKHAGASHVTVTAITRDGRLELTVGDDGRGGADPDGGSGLQGLVDRVSALGGRLEVDSPVGRGTRVRAVLPVRGA